jgi:hypothetical protein
MTPLKKNVVRRAGLAALYEPPSADIPHHWQKPSACGRACWPMPSADVSLVAALRDLL